jgi:hypothetical protein
MPLFFTFIFLSYGTLQDITSHNFFYMMRQAFNELKLKTVSKLSSRKNYMGCSIIVHPGSGFPPIPDPYPDPGVKKAPDPDSHN